MAIRFRWVLVVTFLFAIGFLLFFLPFDKERTLRKKLRQIPLEDQWVIEAFFRSFLLKNGGAYTLFGDKPVTYDAYFDFPIDAPSASFSTSPASRRIWQENHEIQQGWKTWEKYQHLFPSGRFLLKARHLNEHWVEILLINKQNFIQKVEEHNDDFQSIIGNTETGSRLLTTYENGNVALFDLLKKHHGLFGILLGFGKKNAWLYQQRERVLIDFHRFTLKVNPLPSQEFGTITEEREFYQNTLSRVFNENCRACHKFLHLPHFAADLNSAETRQLQEHYLQERRAVQEMYSHGNFLEITLKQFCL